MGKSESTNSGNTSNSGNKKSKQKSKEKLAPKGATNKNLAQKAKNVEKEDVVFETTEGTSPKTSPSVAKDESNMPKLDTKSVPSSSDAVANGSSGSSGSASDETKSHTDGSSGLASDETKSHTDGSSGSTSDEAKSQDFGWPGSASATSSDQNATNGSDSANGAVQSNLDGNSVGALPDVDTSNSIASNIDALALFAHEDSDAANVPELAELDAVAAEVSHQLSNYDTAVDLPPGADALSETLIQLDAEFHGAFVPIVFHDSAYADRTREASTVAAALLEAELGPYFCAVAVSAEPVEELSAAEWNQAMIVLDRLRDLCATHDLILAVGGFPEVSETLSLDEVEDLPTGVIDYGNFKKEGFAQVTLYAPAEPQNKDGLKGRLKGMWIKK